MNNNLTPETEFEKLLLSNKRIVSMINKLKNMADGNFRYLIEKGLLDDHFMKIIANDILKQLFIAEKIGPLELKLHKIDPYICVPTFELYEIDKNDDYEAFESELLDLLNEKLDYKGNLTSDFLCVNKLIIKLAEKYILESKLNKTSISDTKPKKIKV
jgi:hypothetical protein